jgi:hypothetical protein
VEETGVAGENHWPVASHWQTLSHNVVSSTPRHDAMNGVRTHNFSSIVEGDIQMKKTYKSMNIYSSYNIVYSKCCVYKIKLYDTNQVYTL